ncbi:MAG: hypothetical protein KJP00_15185 [Bacteroidia bacterium]|nr:hypothetical protein [Bacteroidia bacterium]
MSSTTRIVLIALLAVSLLLNMFLLSSKYKQNDIIDQQNIALTEAKDLETQLREEYAQAMTDLDEMKSNNEELNGLIENQKSELTKSKNRISALLKDSRNLKTAREEIANLVAQRDEYLAEIQILREENEGLVNANRSLSESNQALNTSNEEKSSIINEIESEKAVLMSQKEEVSAKNAELSAKVNIASVIKTRNIDVSAWRVKKSGVAAQRKAAKNVDYIQICLDTYENEVADLGAETFFVRVLTPLGETMAIENLGSGVLEKSASGDQVKYTKAAEVEYDQNPIKTCLDWNPGMAFQSGKYIVEVYNKGFLSGKGTFELR